MTLGCIVQARLGSTRFPSKITQTIDDKSTVLDYVIDQTLCSKNIENLVIATTILDEDDSIVDFTNTKNIPCFRGHPTDVLDRYYQCAKKFSFSTIVRITSDCPLVDPTIIDQAVGIFQNNSYDYVSNVHPITFPVGIAVEVFSFESLENAWKNAKLPSEREHVTPFLYNNNQLFKIFNIENSQNTSSIRITVDYPHDLDLIRQIASKIDSRPILLSDILNLYSKEPKMFELNNIHDADEGYLKSLENDKSFLKSY